MKRGRFFPVAVGEELTPADTKPPGQLLVFNFPIKDN